MMYSWTNRSRASRSSFSIRIVRKTWTIRRPFAATYFLIAASWRGKPPPSSCSRPETRSKRIQESWMPYSYVNLRALYTGRPPVNLSVLRLNRAGPTALMVDSGCRCPRYG